MEIISLILIVVAMVLIGVGIAVGLVASAAAAGMLGLGVFSSSVAVGIRRRRPAAGIRAFLLQCGILAGIPAGALCAWLAHAFFEAYGAEWPILASGAACGALAGIFIALSLDFVTRRFHSWASPCLARLGASARQVIERSPNRSAA